MRKANDVAVKMGADTLRLTVKVDHVAHFETHLDTWKEKLTSVP